MKLKKYDMITLTKNIDTLVRRGIEQGCGGIVIQEVKNACRILFMNPNNYGDGIFATVDKSDVDYISAFPVSFRAELDEYLSKADLNDETKKFIPCNVKEYDKVELIVEKYEYAKEGVHKGMTGCVTASYAIQNRWSVIFSEEETGKDIAELCVKREDFKVIE